MTTGGEQKNSLTPILFKASYGPAWVSALGDAGGGEQRMVHSRFKSIDEYMKVNFKQNVTQVS